MIAFGAILFLAGIIFLIAAAGQAAQNHAFSDARETTGTVIYKHRHKRKNGYAYLLKLSYSVDGTAYEREIGVLKTEYENINVGKQYKVQYRPDKPKKLLRPQDTSPKTVRCVLIIGAVLTVVGVALIFIERM